MCFYQLMKTFCWSLKVLSILDSGSTLTGVYVPIVVFCEDPWILWMNIANIQLTKYCLSFYRLWKKYALSLNLVFDLYKLAPIACCDLVGVRTPDNGLLAQTYKLLHILITFFNFSWIQENMVIPKTLKLVILLSPLAHDISDTKEWPL